MFPPRLAHIRRRLNRQTLVSAVVLFSFVATSVGLPMEPIGTPRAGCQCGSSDRESGNCCCAKATAVKSCCRPEAAKRRCDIADRTSCCQPDAETRPVVSNCSCGEPREHGLVINGDPRILAAPVNLSAAGEPSCRIGFETPAVPSRAVPPQTPPPEACHGDRS